MIELTWITSMSADDDNHDQETDLDAIGSPGSASWASVSPSEHGKWWWVVYDRWIINEDSEPDPTLAEGHADGEEQAKAAVAEWVAAHTPGAGRVLLRRLRDSLGISGFADRSK
jgi:hypothetical protein